MEEDKYPRRIKVMLLKSLTTTQTLQNVFFEERRRLKEKLNDGEQVNVKDALLYECERVSFEGGSTRVS